MSDTMGFVGGIIGVAGLVGVAALAAVALRRAVARCRGRAAAEQGRWIHAAQMSAAFVSDPGHPGHGGAVRVHNASSSDVHGVTLVVGDPDGGHTQVDPNTYGLGAGHELRITVPAWATAADHDLAVRFVDADDVIWHLDVRSGTVREVSMVGGQR